MNTNISEPELEVFGDVWVTNTQSSGFWIRLLGHPCLWLADCQSWQIININYILWILARDGGCELHCQLLSKSEFVTEKIWQMSTLPELIYKFKLIFKCVCVFLLTMVLVLDKYTKELEMLGKRTCTPRCSKVVLNYNKYKSLALEQKRTDHWNRIETWKLKYMEVLKRCFFQIGGERSDHSTNFVRTLPPITYKINSSDKINNYFKHIFWLQCSKIRCQPSNSFIVFLKKKLLKIWTYGG